MRRGPPRATHGPPLPGIRASPRLASGGMERPNEPQRPGPPITRELPLVPPSPSAGGATQVLTPPAPPQPTGPVDFVPGPPPAVAPERPEEAPVVGPRLRARRRGALFAPVLGQAGVVLLEVSLLLAADGGSFWSRVPLWSGFATFAALLALPAVVG